MKLFLKRLLLFVPVLLVAAELCFRTVLPACRTPELRQDGMYGVLTYDPGRRTDGLYTSGRLAQLRASWHINAQGWNSADDYGPSDASTRIAIIGDSYVEGFYSRLESHLDARLQRKLADGTVVHAFGMSALNLLQTMNVARYAGDLCDPTVFIVVVTHGGLKRSLAGASSPYNLRAELREGEVVLKQPERFTPDRLKRFLGHSACARYLWLNGNFSLGGRRQEAKRRTDVGVDHALFTDMTCRLLRELRRDHSEARFLFVVDADRRAIYADPESAPPPLLESRLLSENLPDGNMTVLDLGDAFASAYRADARPLNFSFNYHWNDRALEVTTDAVASRLRDCGWLDP